MFRKKLFLLAFLLPTALLAGCTSNSNTAGIDNTPATALETQAISTDVKITDQPASVDGKALLEDRCTGCHSLARVTSKTATQDAWLETIKRMIGKGAVLSDEEATILAQYLAEK